MRPETGSTDDNIGPRLGALRRQHGMSIRELARRAEVSASLISEAERGLVEPSVGVLKRLAAALDVTMTYFFSRPGVSGEAVIRKSERRALSELHGIRYELLGPDNLRTLEPIYAHLESGADLGPMIQHEGEEWAIVLSGRLKIWVGSEVYFLDPGDSIYLRSSVPHRIANAYDGETECIWVNSPATF